MAEIRSILIGMVLFSVIVIGMSFFYGDLSSEAHLETYGYSAAQIANMTPDSVTSVSIAQGIVNQTKNIQESLNQSITGLTAVDVAWGYINAGLSALSIPLQAVNLIINLIGDVSDFLNIPPWAAGAIISIIAIVVLLEILSAYLKWRI